MAIKGKKKPKSGGRRPSKPAPKREIVARKVPFWERASVRIGAAAVIALVLGLGLGYGFGKQAGVDDAKAALAPLQRAYTAYQDSLDPILAKVGSAQGGQFLVLPDLKTAIDELQSGKDPEKAMNQLRSVSKDAKTASEELTALDVQAMATGLDQPDSDDMVGARQSLVDGLDLMQQAATLAMRGDKASLASAADLGETGARVFVDGYLRFVRSVVNAKVTLSEANIQGPALDDGLAGNTLAPPPVNPQGLPPQNGQTLPGSLPPGLAPPGA